jgi:hypothetical protein
MKMRVVVESVMLMSWIFLLLIVIDGWLLWFNGDWNWWFYDWLLWFIRYYVFIIKLWWIDHWGISLFHHFLLLL